MDFARLLKTFRKGLRHPVALSAFISLFVIAGVLFVRGMGWLQRAELIVRDQFIRFGVDPNATDDRILIIGMTEGDLETYGFPINDQLLAKLLNKIDEQKPCAMGLDLYRDLPEPRSTSRKPHPELEAAFTKLTHLIVIERVNFIDPPVTFKEPELQERVSGNNLPKDHWVDGVYRRAPVFIERTEKPDRPAFSLMLAFKYLESKGVEFAFEEVPGEKAGDVYQLLKLGKVTIPRLPRNAGGYVNAPLTDYDYLPTFKAPHRHRKMDPKGQYGRDTPYDYSFGEVLEGKLPSGVLTDKIILVATVMQSVKDSNPTPIDDNLRGVQYHAMLVHQLLEMGLNGVPPPRWWPEWAEILWIAGCTLVGGLLGVWLRSPLKLVPAMALLLGGIGFGAWFAFKAGFWILFVAPAAGCFISAALVTSYVVSLERANLRAVQNVLGKHVSKKVANALIEQIDEFMAGGRMPPRAFTGTVIFTDLAGFSTASEKLTAVQTMRWLNEYMEVMVAIVEDYDGTVNKFIGDAIMAVFGAPLVHQDDVGVDADAVRAIRCALHMRREVPVLNAHWKKNSPDMPPVAMRVGIFTGPLVDGSFGNAERMEWTVIGDTVNRANRLEAAGKEIKDQLNDEEKLCSILIGPETFRRVGHRFETIAVPDMPLKGISERATVYRVLSERVSQPATLT